MRRAPDHLINLIEPVVTGMGYECVGVEYLADQQDSVLRVYIDADGGILLNDCSKVSHQLSGVLDVDDPISSNYRLEVSSPGTDRPLFTLDQFDRFRGNVAKVSLLTSMNGRRNLIGILDGLKGESVVLKLEEDIWEIPFGKIRKACLAPDYQITE